MDKYIPLLTVIVVLFSHVQSSSVPFEHEKVPEDVTRFKNFIQEFERGEIRLMPTLQLLRGQFPLAFQDTHQDQQQRREKRDVEDSISEEETPILTEERGTPTTTTMEDDDDTIRQYVRNEINRIFSCYQRLRCGYTRHQAEQECKWLEHSSLYHQLMRMMGIKNYPKKIHIQRGQVRNTPRTPPPPSPSISSSSDMSINPLHQNLQNGIRYGSVKPGQYGGGIGALSRNRNRRYYDSFFESDTKSEVVSPSNPVQS